MKTRLLSTRQLKCFLFNYNSIIILLLLLTIGSFFIGRFTNNYTIIITEASLYGFIAIGLALILVTGYIDLSVGFQAAASAVILILVINATGSIVLGVAAAIALGALMGALNGTVVAVFGIDPLIATISTNYIFKGFVYYFTKDGSIYPAGELRGALRNNIARLMLFGADLTALPIIVFAAALIAVAFMMKRTNFGNNMYIVGDNRLAGQLAGISIKRVTFIVYILCGVCCGIAGVFLASNLSAATYTLGEGRNVFAISACVIGGIRLLGGKGTMLNVLIGVLIMRIISTSMNLLFLPIAGVDFVSGAFLIAVLIIDRHTGCRRLT